MIESFEARYAESRAEVQQTQEQLQAASGELEAAQLRVRELVEAKARVRREAEGAAAGAAGDAAALRQELEGLRSAAAQAQPLRERVQELEGQLAGMRAEQAAQQQQQSTLVDTVDAANEAIMVSGSCSMLLLLLLLLLAACACCCCMPCMFGREACALWLCALLLNAAAAHHGCCACALSWQGVQAMLAEREQQLAQRDAEVQSLQRHLAQLLGMPAAEAPALHRARFGERDGDAAAARIAALEVGSATRGRGDTGTCRHT